MFLRPFFIHCGTHPSMNTTTASNPTVDLHTLAKRERHPPVFTTFKALQPGEAMELFNDLNPQPSLRPFDRGPKQWRAEIVKPLATKPVQGVDSCCGS